MRVLLLLVLILAIIAAGVAEAYCFCPMTTINSVLEDDDDDEHRHHHRPHHKRQHEESSHDFPADGQSQEYHHNQCCCHHARTTWVPIGSRNLFFPKFELLQILPENEQFYQEDLIEPPFRPPCAMAASKLHPSISSFYAAPC